jgi:hypothetical protein
MDNRDNELAELQATVARLTAELTEVKRQKHAADVALEAWPHIRDQLKAEIERLKGGQGEPVMKLEAERLYGGAGEYAVSFVKAGWLDECRKTGGEFLLYASQPAPVSVAIDERAAFEADVLSQCPGADVERIGDGRKFYRNLHVQEQFVGWMARACLDKLKELNQ